MQSLQCIMRKEQYKNVEYTISYFSYQDENP